MIIRNMTPEDIKRVAAIEAQCFSVPWSENSFLDSIAREDTVFLVAQQSEADKCLEAVPSLESGKEILGYIGMYAAFEEGEITNVAVAPEQRQQGVGQELVSAVLQAGKEKNLERIVLEVRVSNKSAISLYKRNGFVELGIRKKFYEKPTEDAIIMACEI